MKHSENCLSILMTLYGSIVIYFSSTPCNAATTTPAPEDDKPMVGSWEAVYVALAGMGALVVIIFILSLVIIYICSKKRKNDSDGETNIKTGRGPPHYRKKHDIIPT